MRRKQTSRLFTKIKRQIQREGLSEKDNRKLVMYIADEICSAAKIRAGPGYPMTFVKARSLVKFLGNLKESHLDVDLEQALQALGRRGYYKPEFDKGGNVVGGEIGIMDPDGNQKSQLWSLLHEMAHYVLDSVEITTYPKGARGSAQRFRSRQAASFLTDTVETLTDLLVAEVMMPRKYFAWSMATDHLFQLTSLYNVNPEAATMRLIDLSPVPLVALIPAFKSSKIGYRIQANGGSHHMVEIMSILRDGLEEEALTCGMSRIFLNAYHTDYSLALYRYSFKKGNRTIVLLAESTEAQQLGIFSAFPMMEKGDDTKWQADWPGRL